MAVAPAEPSLPTRGLAGKHLAKCAAVLAIDKASFAKFPHRHPDAEPGSISIMDTGRRR
jgi:hypothetical protein